MFLLMLQNPLVKKNVTGAKPVGTRVWSHIIIFSKHKDEESAVELETLAEKWFGREANIISKEILVFKKNSSKNATFQEFKPKGV